MTERSEAVDAPGPDADAIPAATVALLRPGRDGLEVLLTRRPTTMAFAGDVHVFPGGRVDPVDGDPAIVGRSVLDGPAAAAALGGALDGPMALAFHVAALRELHEEVGVLLAGDGAGAADAARAAGAAAPDSGSFGELVTGRGMRLRTDLLVPLGHWTTPRPLPRRFDTRFFAALLPDGVEPRFDSAEVVEHRWLTPIAALDATAAGELAMWLPTSCTLAHLAGIGSLDELRDRFRHGPVAAPRVVVASPELTRITVDGLGAVPGRSGDVLVLGRDRLLVVDPGDPAEAALGAMLAAVAGRPVEAVVLTDPGPDRAAGAQTLADRLAAPIVVEAGARRWLPHEVVEVAADDPRLVAARAALAAERGAPRPPASGGE